MSEPLMHPCKVCSTLDRDHEASQSRTTVKRLYFAPPTHTRIKKPMSYISEVGSRFLTFSLQILAPSSASAVVKGFILSLIGVFTAMIDQVMIIWMLYGAAIGLDAILGARIAYKKGAFNKKRFMYGPGEKIAYSLIYFLIAHIVSILIQMTGADFGKPWVVIGLAGWMGGQLLFEASGKFEALSGVPVVEWIVERFPWLRKSKPQQ